ncbi:MAG: NTP transferase domain-containing protein [Terracoccus sp.]
MQHDHPDAAGEATVVVIVLTGGASRRMGQHKPALEVAGRAMVERVVDAARPRRTFVVGSDLAVPGDIETVADDRPGGGPVAGLAAGLRHLDDLGVAPGGMTPSPIGLTPPDAAGAVPFDVVVIVLAGDLPFVTSGHLDRLVLALKREGAAAAVTADDDGRRNWLCAAWRLEALREQVAALGDPAGQSMRRLAEGTVVTDVDHGGEAYDVDTPDELDQARRRAARGGSRSGSGR